TGTDLRSFAGTLRIEATASSHVRAGKQARAMSFGSPGRGTPESRPLPLVVDGNLGATADQAVLAAPIRLQVPEFLVTSTPPDPRDRALPPTPPVEDTSGATVDDLLGERRGSVLDGVDVVDLSGAGHLQEAARRVLAMAAGDPAFEFADADNHPRIATELSEESLRADGTLFSRPVVLDHLGYPRRRADLTGRVAVQLTPVDPEVLDPAQYQSVRHVRSSSSQAGRSVSHTSTARPFAEVVVVPQGPLSPSQGDRIRTGTIGVLIGRLTPWAGKWGSVRGGQIQSRQKATYEGTPERMVLVRATLSATVLAETHSQGNLDSWHVRRAPGVRQYGQRFQLPGAVLMWVTPEQLAAMQAPAPPSTGHVTVTPGEPLTPVQRLRLRAVMAAQLRGIASPRGGRDLPAPASVRPHRIASLGIGQVAGRIDLTDRIPVLRRRLAAVLGEQVANELLPSSPLGHGGDNVGDLRDFLSHVDQAIDTVLNGGRVLPLRLENRFSGHTYLVHVSASFVDTPRFTGMPMATTLGSRSGVDLLASAGTEAGSEAGGLQVSARPMGRFVGEGPEGGRAANGQLSTGVTTRGTLGRSSQTTTETVKTTYQQTSEVDGPVAEYTAAMRVRLSVTHGTTTTGRDRVLPAVIAGDDVVLPVTIRTLPEDGFAPSRADGAMGVADDRHPLPVGPDIAADLAQWRTADGHPRPENPADYVAEHLMADVAELRSAAEQTLRDSGVTVDAATLAALTAGMTSTALKAGLPALLDGGFSVPLPDRLDRELQVQVRLRPKPRLASVNARVRHDGEVKRDQRSAVDLEAGAEFEAKVMAPAGGGGLGDAPASSKAPAAAAAVTSAAGVSDQPFREPRATTQLDHTVIRQGPGATLRGTAQAGSVEATEPNVTSAVSRPDKLSRGLQFDVDFRFVATKAGGRRPVLAVSDLPVTDAYLLRFTDAAAQQIAGELRSPLIDAARAMATATDTWKEADAALRVARAAADADAAAVHTTATAERDAAEDAWWEAKADYDRQLELERSVG
ncbi:MAG: hypothetical protein ACRDQF_09465, partial [Thermocrispum sp.]